MKIKSLTLENFRNIENMVIVPSDGINIIYGDNGEGKTNIIEGIWLFTGDKSFRGARDANLIKFGCETRSRLELNFFAEGRDKQGEIILYPEKRFSLNEIELKSRTGLSGNFNGVIFSPVHLGLIKNGPEERRKFIDQTICQIKPKYWWILNDYSKVLSQRNALIKNIYKNPSLKSTLEVWDYHLARLSATIIKTRYTYLERLKPYAVEIYKGISGDKEILELTYTSKLFNTFEDIETQKIKDIITNNLEEDLRVGSTTHGAHKDDIEISLNNKNARQFASQGQQRSIVLALKLGECNIIKDTTESEPVVLLDDVMSELDISRRKYLLNNLSNRQIFITCCDRKDFRGINYGNAFNIQDGKIIKTYNLNKKKTKIKE